MISTSFCVGEDSITGMTHTLDYLETLWCMCTVFIRYCRIPLGLFQKNTRKSLNSHRERHVPLPISSDFCNFFLSQHVWWLNISKSSCNAHLVFPIAVMWEGYWLAKMCTNREISLTIGGCELTHLQNVIKYYVLQMTVIIGLLPASVFLFPSSF